MSTGKVIVQVPLVKVIEVEPQSAEIIREVRTEVVEIGIQGPQGIPGEAVQGPPGDPGPPGFTYVHNQGVASAIWTINHNLGGYPNITTVDSANTQVEGEVSYVDANTITVTFSAAFGGKAFLT